MYNSGMYLPKVFKFIGTISIGTLHRWVKAYEDRGRLDKKEVWTRVPLVVFYTIFGGELFEKAFHKILEKKNKFKDVISKDAAGKLRTPSRKELPLLAEKIAKQKVDTLFLQLA